MAISPQSYVCLSPKTKSQPHTKSAKLNLNRQVARCDFRLSYLVFRQFNFVISKNETLTKYLRLLKKLLILLFFNVICSDALHQILRGAALTHQSKIYWRPINFSKSLLSLRGLICLKHLSIARRIITWPSILSVSRWLSTYCLKNQ